MEEPKLCPRCHSDSLTREWVVAGVIKHDKVKCSTCTRSIEYGMNFSLRGFYLLHEEIRQKGWIPLGYDDWYCPTCIERAVEERERKIYGTNIIGIRE